MYLDDINSAEDSSMMLLRTVTIVSLAVMLPKMVSGINVYTLARCVLACIALANVSHVKYK